jgi:molybdate transport system regulatory protein
MNSVPASVVSVVKDDLFAQINLMYKGFSFSACVLLSEEEMPYTKTGTLVKMTFKETDTIISLDPQCDVSCRNRFNSKITSIIRSPVITRITADFENIPIVSMITSSSAQRLQLEIGASIICMVKSTSLMLYSED